jgi:hypothetical protein
MVAFVSSYAPAEPATRSKNRAGDFFWTSGDCAGVDRSATRTVAGENDWFSYDACRGAALPQEKDRWSDEDCAELASRIQNLESALPDVAELYGRRAAEFADLGGADALDYLGTSNLLLASGITGIQTAEFARLAGNAVWTERLGTAGTIHAYRGVRAPFLTPQAINGLKIAGRITAGAGIAIDAYNLATADNAYNATVSATNIGIAGYALSFGGPKTAWAAGWYFAGQGLGNFLSDRREYSREFSRLQGLVDEARDLSVYAGSALNQAQQDYQNHCQ